MTINPRLRRYLNEAPPWVPRANGVPASLFLDFTSEAVAPRYWYNNLRYTSEATVRSALGGTFSRASTAYYTNSAGVLTSAASGALRFDYDPVTLQPKGILLEGARTNYATNSADASAWSSLVIGAAVTTNTTVAPDGTATGDTIVFANGGTDYRYNSFSVSGGTGTYVCSVWLQGSAGQKITLRVTDGTSSAYTLVTLTASWTRYSVNLTSTSPTSLNVGFDDRTVIDPGVTTTGVTLQAWGMQAELGSFASSYIPTTTTSATRAADSLSWPVGAWFNSSSGSALIKADTIDSGIASATEQLFYFGSSGSLALEAYLQTGTAHFDVIDTATQAALSSGAISANTAFKSAVAWQANNFALSTNGGAAATDISGTVPAVSATSVALGKGLSGYTNDSFIHVSQFAYWPIRASNSALQSLTQ